jgi:hypothetical protein
VNLRFVSGVHAAERQLHHSSTMADNIAPNADLAKILATLASLQPPGPVAAQDQQQAYNPPQGHQSYQENAQPYPHPQALAYQQSADPRLQNRSISQHSSTTPKLHDRVSTLSIDPATITEWKQGLRCVSKIAQQNPEFAASIRKVLPRQRMRTGS